MSDAGVAVVAGSAAAVATGGNSRNRWNARGVAAAADVATASGDAGELAHAEEPFAWLWARRRASEDAAKLEAAAATLSKPAAADRRGAGPRALEGGMGAGATTGSAFAPEAAPRRGAPAPGTPKPPGRTLAQPYRSSVLQGAGEDLCSRGDAEATGAAPAPGLSAEAAYLYRFAQEAFAALMEREPDPIEAAERAAVAGLEGPAGT
jgi:hypothetical protein